MGLEDTIVRTVEGYGPIKMRKLETWLDSRCECCGQKVDDDVRSTVMRLVDENALKITVDRKIDIR